MANSRKSVVGCVGGIVATTLLKCALATKRLTRFLMAAIIDSKFYQNFITEIVLSDRVYERLMARVGVTQVGTTNVQTREAWLQGALNTITTGSKILDAGAGELQYKKFCSHLEYVSQDFGQYNGVGDEAGLHTTTWDNSKLDIVSDITAIPVPDASFDAVMCIEVFEHIPEPVKAVKEFARVMKSGGSLIITAPLCSMTHFAPFHFSGGYNRYWYEKVLVESGFRIIEILPNGSYFDYLAQELRRMPDVAELYAKTKTDQIGRLAQAVLLKNLETYSLRGQSASELLTFGYHVRAIKL